MFFDITITSADASAVARFRGLLLLCSLRQRPAIVPGLHRRRRLAGSIAIERHGRARRFLEVPWAITFDTMEPDALTSLSPHLDVFAVGPELSFLRDAKCTISAPPRDLFDHNGEGYVHWLDTEPSKLAVYISFVNCKDKKDDAVIMFHEAYHHDGGRWAWTAIAQGW